ncbi:MAG TPA: VCBS repeat-containing protein [Phycisphaerales bacterium]|nr:VCBS repeat-containing protein [Phycisphaerales bacterium]
MLTSLVALALVAANHTSKPQFVEAPGSPFPVGPQAGRLVSADVNGDTFKDIVLACGACCGQKHDANAGHVAVLLNNGKGSFSAAGHNVKVGPTALRVAVADLNGDRHADIACIEHDTYNVHLLWGDGKGAFTKSDVTVKSRDGTRPHSHDIVAADLNADGRADLAVTNANDNTISVLLSNGGGAFSPAKGSPFAAGRHPYEGLTAADFNADGRPDLAVTNLQGNAVAVLHNDGHGAFTMARGFPITLGERPGYVCAGDLNADGRADLLVSHDDVGMIDVLLAQPDGTHKPAKNSPLTLDVPVWGIDIADMDADGTNDAVLAGLRGHILILRGNGHGQLGPERVELKAGKAPCYAIAADFNNDGKMDVASSNYKSGDVTVWLGK